MIRQTYDLDANALYIAVTDQKVARTAEVDTGTLVDLDAAGSIVGIEVISPDRCWPLDEILTRFSVATEDAELLRAYFSHPTQLAAPQHPGVPVAV